MLGGSVAVLLETFPVARLAVTIFGAGHIGRALVQVLSSATAGCNGLIPEASGFQPGLRAT